MRSVGLDQSRVYQVRETSIDRAAVHITLHDGTLAFTQDVAGRMTGAFFEGDGEVLLVPPSEVERNSMALFTGAAILEERFGTAYFRFNDDTYADVKPKLQPAEHAPEFATQWNETAHNLAEADALRLLLSFSRLLPAEGNSAAATPESPAAPDPDRMFHARLQGEHLGTFDVFFDSRSAEQVWAGQLRSAGNASFYDVWTLFSPARAASLPHEATAQPEPQPGEITVSQYTIKAEVQPPSSLTAEAMLQIEVRKGGPRALLFELSRFLQIKQIDADGQRLQFIHNQALEGTQLARQGNDLVAVIFPQPLKTGQKIALRFVYGGDVLSEAGRGLLYVGARGTWYPNRGLAMSNYDLEFRYPVGWTLVATGKRVDSESGNGKAAAGTPTNAAAGQQVSRWISERPIPLAGFNLGRYERASAHAGSVVVDSYATASVERNFPKATTEVLVPDQPRSAHARERSLVIAQPPPSPARNAQAVADRSAQAVDFFTRRFGPYPYSSLALTQMPGELSQGWPGLIFLSSFSFLTAQEKAQLQLDPVNTTISNGVIAHETAHQWWGDLIIWGSYHDQWLFEGLANYSALMLLEKDDAGQLRKVMDKYRDDLVEKDKSGDALMDAGPVSLGNRLSCSRFSNGYETISYGRGTWLFHMLRYMMRDAQPKNGNRSSRRSENSDEPFVLALQKVRERFAGKTITTQDLLHVFAEDLPSSLWYEGHPSLDWFYQSWVNGTAVPRLALQGVKYARHAGSTIVTGAILQKDAPKDLVTSIPLYAVVPGRAPVLMGRIFADGEETSFHLTAPEGTNKILLDPYQTVLSRAR